MLFYLESDFTFVTITPHLGNRRPDHTSGYRWPRSIMEPLYKARQKAVANPLRFLSRSRAAREKVHDHRNDGEKQQDVN